MGISLPSSAGLCSRVLQAALPRFPADIRTIERAAMSHPYNRGPAPQRLGPFMAYRAVLESKRQCDESLVR